jgi:hypothetical protein
MVLSGERLGARDTLNPTRCILVATGGGLGIPGSGFFNINWHKDTDLIEVTQGEFGSGKPALGSTLRICEGQFIILLKDTLMSTEEPFTDRHLSFRLALASCQCVIVQRQGWVEIAT